MAHPLLTIVVVCIALLLSQTLARELNFPPFLRPVFYIEFVGTLVNRAYYLIGQVLGAVQVACTRLLRILLDNLFQKLKKTVVEFYRALALYFEFGQMANGWLSRIKLYWTSIRGISENLYISFFGCFFQSCIATLIIILCEWKAGFIVDENDDWYTAKLLSLSPCIFLVMYGISGYELYSESHAEK